MNTYYLINFIMEAIYLPIHLVFIILLIKNKMGTPVSKWFIILIIGLWGIVGGGFIETSLLLFCNNNVAYVIGVDYQLFSTTVGTMAFLIWSLYIAGHVKVVENKWFRTFIYAISFATVLIIWTNPLHGLFYEKLVLGQAVVHGKLFNPCLLVVYGMLFAGWIISIVNILKRESDKVRRIVYFSLYPLLPGIANLIRSLSGFTLIDMNPLVMSVCIFCLYSMVFKRGYVSILSASMQQAFDQTDSILFVIDKNTGKITDANRIAKEQYQVAVVEIAANFDQGKGYFEGKFGGYDLKVKMSKLDDEILVSAIDVSEIKRYHDTIAGQIKESLSLLKELEEKKRNIDAYLDALYQIPHLKEKQELFAEAEEDAIDAFKKMGENLKSALENGEDSESLLQDNLVISENTITKIRAAVALLKEEM